MPTPHAQAATWTWRTTREQPQRARGSQPAAVTQTQAPRTYTVTIGARSLLHSIHLPDMTEYRKSPLGGDVPFWGQVQKNKQHW